jgi:hypothetical protein
VLPKNKLADVLGDFFVNKLGHPGRHAGERRHPGEKESSRFGGTGKAGTETTLERNRKTAIKPEVEEIKMNLH